MPGSLRLPSRFRSRRSILAIPPASEESTQPRQDTEDDLKTHPEMVANAPEENVGMLVTSNLAPSQLFQIEQHSSLLEDQRNDSCRLEPASSRSEGLCNHSISKKVVFDESLYKLMSVDCLEAGYSDGAFYECRIWRKKSGLREVVIEYTGESHSTYEGIDSNETSFPLKLFGLPSGKLFNGANATLKTASGAKIEVRLKHQCICQGMQSGELVVCPSCKISYHLECVGWERLPLSSANSGSGARISYRDDYYLYNVFGKRAVPGCVVNTRGLCCPYCASPEAQRLCIEIEIDRRSGQPLTKKPFSIIQQKPSAGKNGTGAVFVNGVHQSSKFAFENELRLLDQILYVSDSNQPTHSSILPPKDIVHRLETIYSDNSVSKLFVSIRRWADTCPLPDWTLVSVNDSDDAVTFLNQVKTFLEVSLPQAGQVKAGKQEYREACGLKPIFSDGEAMFDSHSKRNCNDANHSNVIGPLSSSVVASIVRVMVEYSNLKAKTPCV